MKNQILAFLNERIGAGDFPSAVYLVAEKGQIVSQGAAGLAVVEPERIEARIDTIYDLASLTKPLVTGLLCAKLIERGRIHLSDKVSRYFDKFDVDNKREISIGNLLTHTSGFEAWKPIYLNSDLGLRISDLIADLPVDYPLNSKVVYSDLNFMILGALLQHLFGKKLDEIASEEIFEPLGLTDTYFNPPETRRPEIAASEKGNGYERKMCTDLGYQTQDSLSRFRDRVIWGEVHDGNCFYLGGVAGHAGLFSTAADVFSIAQQFLTGRTKLLKPETCSRFTRNLTPGLNEARSLAFQLAETKDSAAGDALAQNSFGHLGFTGTSVWIDPETERIFILLTNRTHARRPPFILLNSVRRRFHSLAVSKLEK